MTTLSYVCTAHEIDTLRKKLAALQKQHDLPVFNFNERSEIPARSDLLVACVSLHTILSALIDGSDKTASNAFCAMVSSYANKIDYSLSYYHHMIPPLSVAYRPLHIRIAWYAEQTKNTTLTR